MSDLDETISEAVDHASESRLNSIIALLVALAATFMALCNVKDGNICQAMQQAQAGALDQWSYYQAKGMKLNLAESMLDLILALSTIAAAFALYHKIQAGRALKRLLKLLEEQRPENPDDQRGRGGEESPREEKHDAE